MKTHHTFASAPYIRRAGPPVVCTRRRSLSLSFVIALSCLACATSFSPSTNNPRWAFSLQARKRPLAEVLQAEVLQPLKPRSSVTDSERQRAVEALARQKASAVVDARMLEMLSDEFLYPPSPRKERPRGRPEMVPGAMNYETLQNYRMRVEGRQDGKIFLTPYGGNFEDANAHYSESEDMRRVRGRPKISMKKPERSSSAMHGRTTRKGVKGERTADNPETPVLLAGGPEYDLLELSDTPKNRKKVVKNLPTPRDRTQDKVEDPAPSKGKQKTRRSSVTTELQRYYGTELLTAKEEYSLGLQVQFMVKCENVHEGLAIKLGRLPTILEWANACGFVDEDKEFFEREAYSDLRPTGCDEMFEEKDPNMFVGNGLASELGVGRGRGRAKKTPPTELKKFFDDTENKFRPQGTPAIPPVLLNTGTPSDFVDRLMDSKDAKQRMVSCNMRLVLSISRKYANVGVNIQDLVQEGSLGLSRAADKFEPKKGFKFSTYASWWIQQAVFRSIAYHSRTIRLPVHVHNLLNRIRKVRRSLEHELGRPPTNEEMARQLDMTVGKYNKMMRLTRQAISLETPKYKQNPKDFGHEGDDLIRDTIDATEVIHDEARPEKGVDRNLFHEDLKDMLGILEEDERRVICARYGLHDGLTRTVTAVAAQMKKPKAWVRSKECRALRKLRRPWYEKRLMEHQNSLTG